MIIYNAIRTPDGTVLQSKYGHDYVVYKDANGFEYFVDGGTRYLRRGYTVGAPPYTEISMYSENTSHENIRKYLSWGTRGKGGRDPVRYVPIESLDTDHIEAILATQYQISQELKQIFNNELTYREQNDN